MIEGLAESPSRSWRKPEHQVTVQEPRRTGRALGGSGGKENHLFLTAGGDAIYRAENLRFVVLIIARINQNITDKLNKFYQ